MSGLNCMSKRVKSGHFLANYRPTQSPHFGISVKSHSQFTAVSKKRTENKQKQDSIRIIADIRNVARFFGSKFYL